MPITHLGMEEHDVSLVKEAKRYRLLDGSVVQMPHYEEPSAMRAEAVNFHLGRPLIPVGDPMTAEVGAGAYTLRVDHPFLCEGEPQVQPMRVARSWRVAQGDIDPRGLPVRDAGGRTVGVVGDLWVDRGTKTLRYLEVRLEALAEDVRPVLVPIYHTGITRHRVKVLRMYAGHLAIAPRLRSPDEITAREEDQVNAYFAAALRFGHPGGAATVPTYAPAPRIRG